MSNVQINIVNNAGADSPLSDPFISMLGTCDGAAQQFNINIDGVCTPVSANGKGSTVIQLSQLKGLPLLLDDSLVISSGRIYFSTQAQAVTNDGITAATAEFYYDWIEFALNSGASKQLVVNTTQVDQFGFPIVLNVDPPDNNFGNTAGICLDRETVFDKFKTLPAAYQDCLFPTNTRANQSNFWRILSPNQALVKKPNSALSAVFVQAIDDFFNFYSNNQLYLNSDSAYPYAGKVVYVAQTGTDGASHNYAVIQFNFATEAPINLGIPTTPPSGTGPYNIYYPFFTTNNPAGHNSFDGKDILPPPSWWQETIAAGTLNATENVSQMVFAGNGIFADTFWQLGIPTKTPTDQAKLLGNLENQLDVAFNRGHANSWLSLTGNLGPSNESKPPYTSTITLSGDFKDQNTPNTTDNLIVGMNVISFAAGIPLTITEITNSTEFKVTSPQPILAQNPQFLTFANFYAKGKIWNAYGNFFHQDAISVGGRAYALSFDDQGGFSSTLTSNWSETPSTLTITFTNWKKV